MVFPKPIEEKTSKTAQSLELLERAPELLERAPELLERAFEVTNSGRFPKNRSFTVRSYLVRDIRMK